MKKLIIVFLVLALVFAGIWVLKLRQPTSSKTPDDSVQLYWWETNPGVVPTPDSNWVLPTDMNGNPVPDNYIPIINHQNLYMVVDDGGNVTAYRRAHLGDDGTWYWETIEDPNIPEGYIPVDGLKDVYMVENIDGSKQYYRYTRNPDNSFFFTEVDENGNDINNPLPTNGEVPNNFVRLQDNIFGMYNEYGVLTGYAERQYDEDGGITWELFDSDLDMNLDTSLDIDTDVTVTEKVVEVGDGKGGEGGKINVITGSGPQGGYTETQTTTDVEHKDGWVYVYETILTLTYDANGELYSTKKDGPNLVNKFPETELNGTSTVAP